MTDLLTEMKAAKREVPRKSRSWSEWSFIPEIRLADEIAIPAWRNASSQYRVMMLNYCEMMERRILSDSRIRALRRRLGDIDCLVFSAVGRDDLLDRLNIENYHRVATELGADYVITPDEYIYEVDEAYSYYQDTHFSRMILRGLKLAELGEGHYRLIGLAKGVDYEQLAEYVDVMDDLGVTDFAFECGDLLKQSTNHQKREIRTIAHFVDYVRRLKRRVLLLGVNSSNVLSRLPRPDGYSSGAWSIDALHRSWYTESGRTLRVRMPNWKHPICNSGKISSIQVAVHNLLVDFGRLSKVAEL